MSGFVCSLIHGRTLNVYVHNIYERELVLVPVYLFLHEYMCT